MKRFLLFAVMLLVCGSMFAQIQIEGGGKAQSNVSYHKNSTNIWWEEDGYYYHVLDYECSKIALKGRQYNVCIYLGQTEDEVRESGEILRKWFNSASNDEYIYVSNPNGDKVCLYKFNANLYASYGTEKDCKDTRITYGLDIASAFLAEEETIKESNATSRQILIDNIAFGEHTLVGIMSFKKDFLKSIKNF